ncbi:MAG: hydroxymethylbilane synthase [Planctomycetia bacterium]|nr:hydroxymethylbilane synthase [Planctomycetia bacterium]
MPAVPPVRIGTRASMLATTQTGWVAERLKAVGVDVDLETISTRGDARRDIPIARIGGDGVFVRELEQALLEGRIDLAVHSLKDMPTAETPGLVLACVPERATPFDAVVGRTAQTLEELPAGAVVGTSSIRRVAQVKAIRGDLVVAPLRGNVDTRLRKLDAGDYDALILAAAGLERLGLAGRITQLVRPPIFWPAVSQGALAIQIRTADDRTRAAVDPLNHAATHAAVVAERRMLAELAAGCLAPVGGWARITAAHLTLGGCVLALDDAGGVERMVVEESLPLPGVNLNFGEVSLLAAAESLGAAVAGKLLSAGAGELLARMRTRLV